MKKDAVSIDITAAGAVDREFLYIWSLPELSQGLPELRQSLPELTQTSTASEGRRNYRVMSFLLFDTPLS